MADGAAFVLANAMPEDGLGERVKAVREGLGLNHDGLSNLTKLADVEGRGISRTSIRGYELGTYKPGARELRILSLALKRSPSWLVFGKEDALASDGGAGDLNDRKPAPAARWFDLAFPLLAFSQLAQDEKRQLVGLVETLLRLKIGEVRFRSMRAFLEDFLDALQDAARDRAQHHDLKPESMKQVLLSTAEDMKKKHGEEEANLLLATLMPFIEFWGASNK